MSTISIAALTAPGPPFLAVFDQHPQVQEAVQLYQAHCMIEPPLRYADEGEGTFRYQGLSGQLRAANLDDDPALELVVGLYTSPCRRKILHLFVFDGDGVLLGESRHYGQYGVSFSLASLRRSGQSELLVRSTDFMPDWENETLSILGLRRGGWQELFSVSLHQTHVRAEDGVERGTFVPSTGGFQVVWEHAAHPDAAAWEPFRTETFSFDGTQFVLVP